MSSTARAAARSASISAASFTTRSGPVTSTRAPERHVGQRGLEVEHEAGPRLVADRRDVRRGAPHEPGDDRDRVVGLVPRARPRTRRAARRPAAPRAAARRAPRRRRRGSDEHGEPLERHRLVAGEVRAGRRRSTAAGRRRRARACAPRALAPWRSASARQRARSRPVSRRSRARFGVVARAHERAGLDVAEAEALGVGAELGELRRASTSGRPAGAGADGRRYWPSVSTSTPTLRRSAMAPRTSSAVSPMPRMMPDLVSRPASVGPCRAGRASGSRRPTAAPPGAAGRPSRGCGSARRAGPRRSRRARRRSPLQSGISTSTAGRRASRARTAAIVAAKPAAPPSARSSRATLVITACSRPSVATASATRARLVGIERQRLAGVDEAEAARPGAPVAEDHERGGVVGPALVDVRAPGLLAHRVEVELSHQPLRLAEVRRRDRPAPASTPAGACPARRPSRSHQPPRAGRAAAPGRRRARVAVPSIAARENAAEVVGVFAPHDVLALDGAGPPKRAANWATTASTTSRICGARRRAARPCEVTPRSRIPHGTMWPNIVRSGSTLSAKPWRVRPCATFTPMAAIFSSPTHTPVSRGSRCASIPKLAERVDERRPRAGARRRRRRADRRATRAA